MVVLVTGASKGIGHAIAEKLGQAGATVAVHYRSGGKAAEALAEKIGNDARAFKANLANPQEVKALYIQVADAYGGLDVLVNNAGVALHSAAGKGYDEWLADWQLTMQVNLTAAALLCKLALPHFAQQGSGRIINITSRAAFRGDTADYMAYAASKGGMVALTRSIARAYGKQGITAFSIAPGFTRTDMAQEFIDTYGEDFALNDIALKKLTEPKDIAPLVTFIASGLADHATGTNIDVNAGSYVH